MPFYFILEIGYLLPKDHDVIHLLDPLISTIPTSCSYLFLKTYPEVKQGQKT